MSDILETMKKVQSKVASSNSRLAQEINETIRDVQTNPMIASFAKPVANVTLKEDGTIHSFAVEIKSNQDGPIPDTQLMSKILQAIESHNNVSDGTMEMSAKERPVFEVVSFKYERREDNKKK